MFSKMANMVRPGSVKNANDARFDSTLRPICFDLPLKVTKAAGLAVGPQKFKRYEHILYLGAQLSRLV